MSNTLTGREVLRLIADGVGIEEFEHCPHNEEQWAQLNKYTPVFSISEARVQFRRKPQTRIINGFTVPAPETKAPPHKSEYFLLDIFTGEWVEDMTWDDTEPDHRWLQRGLVFLDKDAAIANAKAMCGIDPSKGEEK